MICSGRVIEDGLWKYLFGIIRIGTLCNAKKGWFAPVVFGVVNIDSIGVRVA